MFILLIKLNTN